MESWFIVRSQYLARLLSLCWITFAHTLHPPIEGLLPLNGIEPTVSKFRLLSRWMTDACQYTRPQSMTHLKQPFAGTSKKLVSNFEKFLGKPPAMESFKQSFTPKDATFLKHGYMSRALSWNLRNSTDHCVQTIYKADSTENL